MSVAARIVAFAYLLLGGRGRRTESIDVIVVSSMSLTPSVSAATMQRAVATVDGDRWRVAAAAGELRPVVATLQLQRIEAVAQVRT